MSTSTDVLIIGGGIVGAATAYQLSWRGARVILLESDRLASGATGRNLGYIWLHTRRKGPELDLAMVTRNEREGLPEELGADFGGDPSALLARFVRRIDRLEDEGVGAGDYAAWAAALPDDDDDAARVRAAREREFAAAWAAHFG